MPDGTATLSAEEDQAPDPGPGLAWRIVSIAGEVLITVGVLLLLVVVYELWWTNVEAEQEAQRIREELTTAWEDPVFTPPIPEEAFALMYIPRLQADAWATPVIEGVGEADLTKGFGHFPGTALPGEVGNSSFAGHRATHGQPLANVDQLRPGDMVYIETAVNWYSYTLTIDDLVAPNDVWVIDPTPGQPAGTEPTESLLTLVTCHPRWGSSERWVWWGELTDIRSKSEGPPEEVADILRAAA